MPHMLTTGQISCPASKCRPPPHTSHPPSLANHSHPFRKPFPPGIHSQMHPSAPYAHPSPTLSPSSVLHVCPVSPSNHLFYPAPTPQVPCPALIVMNFMYLRRSLWLFRNPPCFHKSCVFLSYAPVQWAAQGNIFGVGV